MHIIAWIVVAAVGFSISWGRISLYRVEYADAFDAYNIALAQQRYCRSHHHRSTFRESCTAADRILESSPASIAITAVVSQTHSCIEVPCSEILQKFMETWAGFAATLLIGGIILVMMMYAKKSTPTAEDSLPEV